MKRYEIGFIGFGNMAGAIVKQIISKKIFKPEKISIFDINESQRRKAKRMKINVLKNNQEVVDKSKIVVFSVKPQDMESVLKSIKEKGNLFISICAGITTKFIKKYLGNVPVIRVMPNTPFLVGEGVTGCYFKGDKKYKKIAEKIFGSGSSVYWIKDEKLLDSITALSGSGPAYVFYFIESLAEAGKILGIKNSLDIAIKTLKGSITLIEKTKEKPEVLRKKVTSKGGTTERAVSIFEKRGFKNIIIEALKEARKRSKELSK
ncbi:MAG: pyrroline-5-carboxylate reductase [Caldiserica bacterium]|nr:MAG: pyrroline-5-carboxylate reductase [Caldisericota bacterium]